MTATYVPDMSMIEQMEKTVGTLQGEISERISKVEKLVDKLIEGSALMGDDDFWAAIKDLAKEVKYAKDNTKLACDRFLHEYIFGRKTDPYAAMRFIRTYNKKVDALYKPLFDTIDGFGDDGYGDILDSFPLFGRERYEKALKGEIEGSSKDQYQGENYMRMSLEDVFKKKFAIACWYEVRDSEED